MKEILYNKKDNITELVNCLEKDKYILENIPHQPGEFSSAPFKHTTTCNPKKRGDYYEYYTGTKQLATFKHNIHTPFKHIKIKTHNNIILNRFTKTALSIHPQYEILNNDKNADIKIDYGLCFILKGELFWNHFFLDWLPYLNFASSLLKDNPNIKIIAKDIKFDSYHYILQKLLNINNETYILKPGQNISINTLYEIELEGPFASGLFPYMAYSNCPVTLYRNMYNSIHNNIPSSPNNTLIYAKRNTPDTNVRHIKNENLIINILQNYCSRNNLNFINFYYKDYSIEERIQLFNGAKFVIGVHGAAMMHTVFCKNAKIIEFICIKDCHSTQLVNLSYNLEYWQIPLTNFGQFQKIISVDDNAIKSLIEILS